MPSSVKKAKHWDVLGKDINTRAPIPEDLRKFSLEAAKLIAQIAKKGVEYYKAAPGKVLPLPPTLP